MLRECYLPDLILLYLGQHITISSPFLNDLSIVHAAYYKGHIMDFRM
jgi:hypothetical protein